MQRSLWLISFGDLLTLILCFFLAIISLSPPSKIPISRTFSTEKALKDIPGTKIAENPSDVERRNFSDWSLTLNHPEDASNEVAKVDDSLFRSAQRVRVSGCFHGTFGKSPKQGATLIGEITDMIREKGTPSLPIEAGLLPHCDSTSVLIEVRYG